MNKNNFNNFNNFLSKYKKVFASLLIISLLCGCAGSQSEFVNINGYEVKRSLVDTGFYFDLASLSDAQLLDMVDRINVFDMPDYTGEISFSENIEDIEIIYTTPSVATKAEIESDIEERLYKSRSVRIVTEKRECKIGDTVTIDFEGKIEGEEFSGGKAENQEIVLGEGQYIEGFEEGIIGKKAGEKFDISVTFPNDYQEESLRGKKATFTCIIKYIKETVVPILDTEFIQNNSRINSKTVSEFLKEVEDEVNFRHEYAVKENMRNNLLNKLYTITLATPSEEVFAWNFTKTIAEEKRIADVRSISIEEQLTNNASPLFDSLLYKKYLALQTLADPLIMKALQEKYNITFTNEDKMNWFHDLCVYNNYGKDVTYKVYSDAMGEAYIEDNARKAKVLDEVLKHVKIVKEKIDNVDIENINEE